MEKRMPIECHVEITPVGQERFHAVDKVVMGHVFDIHNTLGRFCDEGIYQEELAQRCRADGIEVQREVLLRALYQGFAKPYYLDMLVERGVIYELKAADSLNTSHQKQLINYLLLANLSHGKLVNFRPGSVESRFVSTRLRQQDRETFRLADGARKGEDQTSRLLRETLCALLVEWGVFLDVNLYREALLYFLDGPDAGVRPVDVVVSGRIVGVQKMCLLNAGTAWHLSAVRERQKSYETHLVRLLGHLQLEKIHWINFDHRTITIKTLNQ
ncbi:MAG: GxxExxY protein [Verrucomicrobia bacterium]|nr:GxxExxY protein [Verrucomicrobiota bacterium]